MSDSKVLGGKDVETDEVPELSEADATPDTADTGSPEGETPDNSELPEDADPTEPGDAYDADPHQADEPASTEETADDAALHDDDLHDDDHEHEEERGMSLSSRILLWLCVLLAGAAGALWGGPKLAPHLPGWASPVAEFLTPGGDTALARVEEVRAEIGAEIAAIETGPDMEALNAAIQSAQTEALAPIEERLGALENSLNAAAETESRLTAIETRLDGLAAEVTSLGNSLQEAAIDGGNLTDAARAEIASNAAVLDAIRAEIEGLAGEVGSMSNRVATFEAEAARQVAEAAALEQSAALQERLAALTDAVSDGRSYAAELDALKAVTGAEIPAPLVDAAETGIPPIRDLKAAFGPLAHEAIRGSIRNAAEDSGAMGRVSAFFQSRVATRSLEPIEGDSTDAVLSRIEAALDKDDLARVLSEAETLPEPARALLSDWLSSIQARQTALTALGDIAAQGS